MLTDGVEEVKVPLPKIPENNINDFCYEDRDDISPTLACVLPHLEEKKKTESEFENIESLVYYLEVEYGFDKFNKIYQIIRNTEIKQNDESMIKEYLSKLNGIVEKEKILKNLFLFIALKQIEERARIN